MRGNDGQVLRPVFRMRAPAAIAHVQKLAERGRAGQTYNLQLPREAKAEWSLEAISYWRHFGEILGSPKRSLPVPVTLTGVVARAVAIRPQYAARMKAYDVNIITQTLDPPGQGFDLMVATNVLVYCDRFQQALGMANIARMLNRGGIFLANNVLPAQHTGDLEYLGRRPTTFSTSGAYGDESGRIAHLCSSPDPECFLLKGRTERMAHA